MQPAVPATRLPLSTGQSEIWFIQQLEPPESTTFKVGEYLEIQGPIDAAIFERALRQAVAEAEPYNVRVGEDDGVPWQVLDPVTDWDFPVLDLSGEPDPHAAAVRWMKHDLATGLELDARPLFSFALLKLSDDCFLWYQGTHHIVSDAGSAALLGRRTAEIYTALTESGDPVAGETVFGSLRTMLDRDEEYRSSEDFAKDRAYWTEHFADSPEPARLSGRPGDELSSVLRETAYLTEAEAVELRAAARKYATHWSAMIIAATATYLHRLTGKSDIILTLPVTARTDATLRGIPGMFANVVPLRIQVRSDMRIRDLVRQVSREVRQALRHQRYRHIDLARDLHLPDGGNGFLGPHVNIMTYDYDFDFAGHRVIGHNLSNGTVEDLSIMGYDRSDGSGIRIDLNANSNLYTADSLIAHRERYLELLRTLSDTSDKERTVGAIELLSAEERRRAAEEWNDTAHPTSGTTLPGLFAAQTARTPDAEAVVFGGTRLSYAELDRAADRLAARLTTRGAGPERTVAVALPRSPELVVALLAVLKSGAAYLPLELDYPADRLAFMLDDAAPALLVTRAEHTEQLPAADGPEGVERLLLDDTVVSEETDAPRVALDPEHPAYVIYTSGSTGRPKGVLVPHRAIVNCLEWMQGSHPLTPEDRLLQKTPAGFDASVAEFFWPLVSGATLVLAQPGGHKDPAYLVRTVREERITTLQFVPSMLRAFLAEPDVAERCADSLRQVFCGGEALPRETVDRFHTLLPGIPLHNVYGPTEATVDISAHTCEPGDRGPVPIGAPVWNSRLYVLDSALRHAPAGAVGEVYLAGPQLARGYHDRSSMTAERFVPDPYGHLFGAPGARMYRTGDLARRLPDGGVAYLGRSDDQVKLRGFRIETGEVEAALRALPDVAEAAAIVREDQPGDQRLVAYLTAEGGTAPCVATAREMLHRDLPEHMVPTAFMVLDTLPLSPNGKLDRAALPVPSHEAARGGRAPRTPREETLCALFGEVLGIPDVTIDDDFFLLGGHSLLASKLASQARTALDTELSMRDLFEAPTVARLVARLDEATPADAPQLHPLDTLLPLRGEGERAPLFCVHPGGGLGWSYTGLMRHLAPDQPVYALQARGLTEPDVLPANVQEMAADYLDQIRTVQPTGPYHLLGWSFGGLIAHAMATRLQSEGEEVATLTVIDAYPDNDQALPDLPDLGKRQWLGVLLDNIGGGDIFAPGWLEAHPDGIDDGDQLIADLSRETGLPKRLLEGEHGFPLLDIFLNDQELMRKFAPERFEGDLLLFTADEEIPGYERDALHVPESWQPYVSGEVKVHGVPAHHYHLLREQALTVVGPTLARALDATHHP
ncbi:enterobactin synthetase component F [Streptomyces himastatinicus ATCC 53653]|uniref:Enterobactin synthetase component F n=1 Tax=Streptomyces himastatinicus ATCC 53653 TaxID=457427 RepID=D9WKG0_9ACTN|nr:non-ribosomal peptide synthetase [Streptomyces himastatinicus]EFL25694.1 enterobactin synthetase component F [Streptomyces himastatinicus ATCC 53653]